MDIPLRQLIERFLDDKNLTESERYETIKLIIEKHIKYMDENYFSKIAEKKGSNDFDGYDLNNDLPELDFDYYSDDDIPKDVPNS